MDHASLDGGGSFKAPVEQKKERGDKKEAKNRPKDIFCSPHPNLWKIPPVCQRLPDWTAKEDKC